MCFTTTSILEEWVPKLKILASLAKLLNSWCDILTSVTFHQISFLQNVVCYTVQLPIPLPFRAEIVDILRSLVFDFCVIFFLYIIAVLRDAVPWNCEGLASSSDWIDLLIWGRLPSLWLYCLPVMIHLYSFSVYVPVQLSILTVLMMYYWMCFLPYCLVSLYWPYWWKSCLRKEVFSNLINIPWYKISAC